MAPLLASYCLFSAMQAAVVEIQFLIQSSSALRSVAKNQISTTAYILHLRFPLAIWYNIYRFETLTFRDFNTVGRKLSFALHNPLSFTKITMAKCNLSTWPFMR